MKETRNPHAEILIVGVGAVCIILGVALFALGVVVDGLWAAIPFVGAALVLSLAFVCFQFVSSEGVLEG